MSQGLRVKEIRKILKLNQTEFGNQLMWLVILKLEE